MLNLEDEELSLNVSMLLRQSFAVGLGKRFVIYLSNGDGLDQSYDKTVKKIAASIDEEHSTHSKRLSVYFLFHEIAALKDEIDGLSILVLDPSKQAVGLAELARMVKGIGLSIMLFSQPSLAELRSRAASDKNLRMLLFHTDDLVEQAYQKQLKCQQYAWQGSSNQSLHLLSDYDKEVRRRAFQVQKPSIELRIRSEFKSLKQNLDQNDQFSEATSVFMLRSGWPHDHKLNKKIDPLQKRLNLKQLGGKQWIEDLFYREYPSVSPKAQWPKDDVYWGQVLAVSKQRCLKWLIQNTINNSSLIESITYPIMINYAADQKEIRQLQPFDQDLYKFPLVFGPATQALFSGPKALKIELIKYLKDKSKTSKSNQIARAEQFKSRHLDLELKQAIYYGDWILLSSLYNKLTRPKMMTWLCHELLERKSLARSAVLDWLFDHSPLLALFEPKLGIEFLTKPSLKQNFLAQEDIQSFFRLICPTLPTYWTRTVCIERVREGFYSADTWAHLEAITELNRLALESDFYALAEACIKTIAHLLSEVAVEDYFKLSAPSMLALKVQRTKRLRIVQIAQVWEAKIEKAQVSIYGDANYLESQILLSFAQRWKEYQQDLKPFIAYGEVIITSS